MANQKLSAVFSSNPFDASDLDDTDILYIVRNLATTPESGSIAVADFRDLMHTPSFDARQTEGNETALADSTATAIVCDQDDYDPDNYHNTSTGRFTPGVAGTYFIYAQIFLDDLSDGNFFRAGLRKNGSTWRYFGYVYGSAAGSDWGIAGARMVYLNGSTDYVQMYGYHNEGSSLNTRASSDLYTAWGGFRIASSDICGY